VLKRVWWTLGEKRGWFWLRKQSRSSQCSLFSVVVKLQPLDFVHLHAVTLKGLGLEDDCSARLFFFFFPFSSHAHRHTPWTKRKRMR